MKRTALACCAVILAVVLPACDDNNDTPAAPTITATPAPPSGPPVPPPTAPPVGNQVPSLVFHLRPEATGSAPFTVTANMCGSADPEGAAIVYEYKWGGTPFPRPHFSYFCRDDHVYTEPGSYRAFFCVNDDHDNRVCQNVLITVN
jgi:hypothetical protein